MLSADTYCVLNPQRDKVAEKLLFNVLCAARNACRYGGRSGGIENELQMSTLHHT